MQPMKIKQLTYLSVIFLIMPFGLLGQKVKVETTKLEIKDNKLVISYSFVKSKKNQLFDVWLSIKTETGKVINANSLSGDIGKNILGGEDKQIVWDFNKDGIILNEEVSVEVLTDIVSAGASSGKAILLSSIVPSLGLTNLDKGNPYWLLGVATYGALGASVFLNNKAVTDYDSYKTERNKETSNTLFSNSEKNEQLSKTMAYSAAGIWAVSMVWTVIKAKKSGKSVASSFNKKKLFFHTGINPKTKIAGFSLKYRF